MEETRGRPGSIGNEDGHAETIITSILDACIFLLQAILSTSLV